MDFLILSNLNLGYIVGAVICWLAHAYFVDKRMSRKEMAKKSNTIIVVMLLPSVGAMVAIWAILR